VACTRAATFLVSAVRDNAIRVWNLRTGEQLRVVRGHLFQGRPRPVKAVAFNPDGTVLASGGADGVVRLWDVKAGQQTAELSTVGTVDSVAFSPDGSRLAAAG